MNPWYYVAILLAAVGLAGGGYAFGRVKATEKCVLTTLDNATTIRKEEAQETELRMGKLQELVVNLDTLYQSQRITGEKLAADLRSARERLAKADQAFRERLSHVSKTDTSCRVPDDIVRLLGEGLAGVSGTGHPGETGTPGLSPGTRIDGSAENRNYHRQDRADVYALEAGRIKRSTR